MTTHGESFMRGSLFATQSNHARTLIARSMGLETMPSQVPVGRFGRLFNGLPTYEPTNAGIKLLANTMEETEDSPSGASTIPLAHAYLGQFIDHDITFDPVSRLDERLDPEAVRNFRTPALDLDNVYGEGPDVSRHLYDTTTDNGGTQHRLPYRLLTGSPNNPLDLPRNRQGAALIGDPRNDENLLVSQLQAAFLRFHNEVVKKIIADSNGNPPGNKDLFAAAREVVTTHYHWIVVNEFLPHIVGQALTDDIIENGRRFYCWEDVSDRPYIPVEFSGAAYRFGHSMINTNYELNDQRSGDNAVELFDLPFFGIQNLDPSDENSEHEPAPDGYDPSFNLDIAYFAETVDTSKLQFCRKTDTQIASTLFHLPFIHQQQDAPESLPERNMRRGRTLKLPAGQDVAAAMGITPLDNSDLGIEGIDGLGGKAPLWFYILKESENAPTNGAHLGPTGGRIVAETLLGLIEFVQRSYKPDFVWADLRPSLVENGDPFTLADLWTFKA